MRVGDLFVAQTNLDFSREENSMPRRSRMSRQQVQREHLADSSSGAASPTIGNVPERSSVNSG